MSEVSLKTSTSSVTVEGRNLTELRSRLATALRAAYRGSWLLDSLESNQFTMAGLREYYVEREQQTVLVRRAYRDAFRGPVKSIGSSGYRVVLPKRGQLWDAYDNAHRNGQNLITKAVRQAHAPFVAQIGIVDAQLGRFKLIHELLTEKGHIPKDWAPRGGTDEQSRRYLIYLQEMGLIMKATEGYKFSHEYEGLVRPVHELLERYGHPVNKSSPLPFLAVALQKPEYLATKMSIRSPITYFEILEAIFQYQASATSESPEDFPITLERLLSIHRRRFNRPVPRVQMSIRAKALANIGALTQPGTEKFSLAGNAFAEAAQIAAPVF